MFDSKGRGELTPSEFKDFFAFVFDLSLDTRDGRHQYRKVLAKLEMGEVDAVPRILVIDFVVERGAIELREVADEIKQLSGTLDLPLNITRDLSQIEQDTSKELLDNSLFKIDDSVDKLFANDQSQTYSSRHNTALLNSTETPAEETKID